ncbi:MAG: hypothetical protein HY711_02370 [Candidatus Melainabacteria bacterium]|nr:hypothetical protein [Candidatus Melainabacteria bacterium]
MRSVGFSISILILFVGLAVNSYAFSSFADKDGAVHEQITRDALAGTISDANLAVVIKAIISQDIAGSEDASESRRHFSDDHFSACLAYIDREKKKALNYACDADTDPDNRARALKHFGLMLHTAQDFYSKTNYVELQLEDARKIADPFNIELVDWAKIPDGYVGPVSRTRLAVANQVMDLNKDNAHTPQGKKAVAGTTYFVIAKDLAVRETQRQWNLFETLLKARFQTRAAAIITALRQASPGKEVSADSFLDLND